jgi:hypothetical protein
MTEVDEAEEAEVIMVAEEEEDSNATSQRAKALNNSR